MSSTSRLPLPVLLTAVGLVLTACGGVSAPATVTAPALSAEGCISDFDPASDYFPDKSTLRDAENFTLTYQNSYQVLTVKQPYPGGKPES